MPVAEAAVDIALGPQRNNVGQAGDRIMGRKKPLPPFEVEITGLVKGGCGTGVTPDGHPVKVKFAPPGARLKVIPMGKRKGVWSARRDYIVRRRKATQHRCDSLVFVVVALTRVGAHPSTRRKIQLACKDVATEMETSIESLRGAGDDSPNCWTPVWI